MKLLNIILMLSLLVFIGCSLGSNSDDLDTSSDIEMAADGLEGDEIELDEADSAEFAEAEPALEQEMAPVEQTAPIITGEMGEYTIEAGDTFMLIAFKIYGNYARWRELEQLNPIATNRLVVGSTIKYTVPATKFTWNPEGNPHLIMRGETLGTISEKYYNTNNKWRNIWNNNRAMIKDPNLIFAGFTLFYPNLGNLASN